MRISLQAGTTVQLFYFKLAPNMKIHTQVWWNFTLPLMSLELREVTPLSFGFVISAGRLIYLVICPKDKLSETPMLCEQQSPYY